MSIVLSSNFTQTSAFSALCGGLLLGGLAASRLATTRVTQPCASMHPRVTIGFLGYSFLFYKFVHGDASILELDYSNLGWGRTVLAGSMVGVGALLGQGCTSGCGIQGVSAYSPTSLGFVVIFMLSGMVTAYFGGGSSTIVPTLGTLAGERPDLGIALFASAVAGIAMQALNKPPANLVKGPFTSHPVADVAAGAAFASALILSGMAKRSGVISFLDVFNTERGWDPSVMFVMGGGIGVAAVAFHLFGLIEKSAEPIKQWIKRPMDLAHVIGGVLFGAGWGLSGLCPGPVFVNAGMLVPKAAGFMAAMYAARKLVTAVLGNLR